MKASVSRALQHLLRSKPAVIMVASTTAPAGPEDVIGRAMTQLGGTARTLPRAGRAGQSAHAGVQGRGADRVGAGLFPLGQAQCVDLDVCRRCWRATASRAGKSRAWATEDCWGKATATASARRGAGRERRGAYPSAVCSTRNTSSLPPPYRRLCIRIRCSREYRTSSSSAIEERA